MMEMDLTGEADGPPPGEEHSFALQMVPGKRKHREPSGGGDEESEPVALV
jgi:hypothetical protein